MRKLLLVVCVLSVIGLIVTGASRKFGQPHVVHSDTQMIGPVGKMIVVIHKDEWPNIWRPSLDYEVMLVGTTDEKGMPMTETVKMEFRGSPRVVLNCVGVLMAPEPMSVCNAPELGLQPPELIKAFRQHLNVYEVIQGELSKQLSETQRQLNRNLRMPDPDPDPTASPIIY